MAPNLKHDQAEYVDVEKAARILGVSASFLNKLRVYGGGPRFVRLGHAVRYNANSLREWAKSQTRCSTSDSGAA